MNVVVEKIIKNQALLIAVFLCILTLIPYWQVRKYDFVTFDDPLYVTKNEQVKKGLTLESIRSAFSLGIPGERGTYWHPLTTLSHTLDVQLFGLDGGVHHLVNLVVHSANVVLLFLVFTLMTRAPVRSGLVALLFALHPVNVDSVAWIAERKNLLSTFFWLLTMLCYYWYTRKLSIVRYGSMVVIFSLGLLSKPMLVSLPFVLLLLDYWPLKRITFETGESLSEKKRKFVELLKKKRKQLCRLVLEKIPLLVLSLVSIYVSMLSLRLTRQIGYGVPIPFGLRVENAIVSYIHYLYKMVLPLNLTFFYPFPKEVPFYQVALSALLIGMMTLVVFTMFRRHKYLTVGWLWYLGTLFPVIGLVQGGLWPQIAERWAYVPFIGIFIMVVWGGWELLSPLRFGRIVAAVVSSSVIIVLMIMTYTQTGYWKDNYTFYTRGIEVNSANYIAFTNLGIVFLERKDFDKARDFFEKTLEITSTYPYPYYNLARIAETNNPEEAISFYYQALQRDPGYLEAYKSLAKLFLDLDRLEESMQVYEHARKIYPNDKYVLNGIASVLLKSDKPLDAKEYLNQVLQKNPRFAIALNNMGVVHNTLGNTNEAIDQFLAALQADPTYAEAYNNLAILYQQQGRDDEALTHFLEAVRHDPEDEKAHYNLGVLYAKQNNISAAREQFVKAVQINPEHSEAHYGLALCYSRLGTIDLAMFHLRETLRIDPDEVRARQILDVLLEQTQAISDEITRLSVLEEQSPRDPRLLLNLVVRYKQIGEVGIAMEYLKKIATLLPENHEVYYNMACLSSIQNRIDETLEHLEKAIEKGFSNWELMKTDPDLENVRADARFQGLISG